MNDDEKIRAELKETIDEMAPEQNQRDRIWNHIEEKMYIAPTGGTTETHKTVVVE